MNIVPYVLKSMTHTVKVVQDASSKAVGKKGMMIFHHIQENVQT